MCSTNATDLLIALPFSSPPNPTQSRPLHRIEFYTPPTTYRNTFVPRSNPNKPQHPTLPTQSLKPPKSRPHSHYTPPTPSPNLPMADYFHTRRQIIMALFLILTFICFMAASSNYWMHFAVFAFAAFMWLICDFMFLEQTQFVFEPNVQEWQKKSKLDYF